jgi:hypothetical protein
VQSVGVEHVHRQRIYALHAYFQVLDTSSRILAERTCACMISAPINSIVHHYQILNITSKLDIKRVFLATDTDDAERAALLSSLPGAFFTEPPSGFSEAQAAIFDQAVCARASAFIGNFWSTVTKTRIVARKPEIHPLLESCAKCCGECQRCLQIRPQKPGDYIRSDFGECPWVRTEIKSNQIKSGQSHLTRFRARRSPQFSLAIIEERSKRGFGRGTDFFFQAPFPGSAPGDVRDCGNAPATTTGT